MEDDDITRAANAKRGSPFLTTEQAARYVGLSRRALEKMRRKGTGPRFRRHGRYVRYHIADLDAWSEGRDPQPLSSLSNTGEGSHE
jgi:excisionase family DNA binding protein